MRNENLIKGLSVIAVISFMACNPQKPAPVIDKEQVKKEIQDKENEFAATYNSGVAKNIGYYADDAISFSQNRAPLVGKAAIVEYIKAGIDSSSFGNKISFVTNEVFPSNDGNQVLELGYYTLVDSSDALINSGNYMVLFEKRNGKYVSVREMSASDIPLE
ncbi:MAG: nuclear transport factor 2 family protein [Chitinophagaceae bacterium]|nr:nuclear transport factor 2 family protein [Chitinophagaceae bacterium]